MEGAHAPGPGPFLPRDRAEAVNGWAGSWRTVGYVYRPSTVEGIGEVFALARETGLSVALRGGGNSYGDAATGAERIVLDLTRMDRVLDWNPQTGTIRVEPGVTIRDLWRYIIGDGWWPAVVPGTMFPTIGGAAAANIHGKNHVAAGVLGDHLLEFDLLLPGTGEIVRCARAENPALFHAALGSFGMLGVFTSLTLQLKKVSSGLVRSRQVAAADLREMFTTATALLPRSDYLVGWIDGFAEGASLGRGLLQISDCLAPGEDPTPAQSLRADAQEPAADLLGFFPKSAAWRLMKPWMNDTGMRTLNALRWNKARRLPAPAITESLVASQFLLDYVPNWKRAYGPGGLLQYQFQVPDDTARDCFHEVLSRCQLRGLISYLIVFKRHRAAGAYLLDYSADGWSLAMDFKVTQKNRDRLAALLAELDRIVLEAGGRFYFAKDQTLRPEGARAFLGEEKIRQFLAIKRRVDPEGLLQTDLFRRLFAGAWGEGVRY